MFNGIRTMESSLISPFSYKYIRQLMLLVKNVYVLLCNVFLWQEFNYYGPVPKCPSNVISRFEVVDLDAYDKLYAVHRSFVLYTTCLYIYTYKLYWHRIALATRTYQSIKENLLFYVCYWNRQTVRRSKVKKPYGK